MHGHDWVLLAAAGFGAGVVNAIAGGGSLLSFPALLLTGIPAVTANATNTVAVWPGTVAAAWAYRRRVREERRRAWTLAWPSLAGGLAGSVLLLHTPERSFRAVVPWLVLFACALLLAQEPVARLVARGAPARSRGVPAALWVAQFLIAVYGGYFGAGMGILMLAVMAIFLETTLQHANAVKLVCSLLINGIAAVYFMASGAVRLPEAGLMAAASLAGGYAGAHLAQRLRPGVLRTAVVVYGLVVAVRLFQTG